MQFHRILINIFCQSYSKMDIKKKEEKKKENRVPFDM